MKRVVLAPVLLLLLLPAAAEAKGTNVRISSAPNGTDAGEAWTPLITIVMPGNGRFGGLRPKLIIRRGVMHRSFAARPAGRTGVYRVRVVFPSRGRWRYGVDDGLDRFEPGAGRVHRFPAVRIGAGEPAIDEPPLPTSGEVEAGPPPPRDDVLPPEVYRPPAKDDDEDDGGGWLPVLPAGLAAVAGAVVLVRRQRR